MWDTHPEGTTHRVPIYWTRPVLSWLISARRSGPVLYLVMDAMGVIETHHLPRHVLDPNERAIDPSYHGSRPAPGCGVYVDDQYVSYRLLRDFWVASGLPHRHVQLGFAHGRRRQRRR